MISEPLSGAVPQTRRSFIKTTTAALALAPLASFAAESDAPAKARDLKRAIMWATVGLEGSVLDKMKAIKAAGFDGTEMVSHMDQDEVLRARDETGLTLPSVCGKYHWSKPLSDPD
ncbi:MAG TPA: twin-arginine translocation signal domain-containing protein, partial [Verrucomicrobiae bacterium]|nr:twin-arginine translocation signal domain-containing protein [Verrucomicrobiae bacterium]